MSDNPQCPKCGGTTVKGGKMRSGNQRYYCRSCNHYFSPVPTGRAAIGEQPLSNAERQRRYRAKIKKDKEAKQ